MISPSSANVLFCKNEFPLFIKYYSFRYFQLFQKKIMDYFRQRKQPPGADEAFVPIKRECGKFNFYAGCRPAEPCRRALKNETAGTAQASPSQASHAPANLPIRFANGWSASRKSTDARSRVGTHFISWPSQGTGSDPSFRTQRMKIILRSPFGYSCSTS